ncbi:5968_t:CDS:2 [Ambispora gerdemannii]|uniref:5968_t:CDS:1 n=1 Tax=Ambispora gerdemannii TaxID=144530 RepID=A0A9N9A2I6_9GLOM|nr:5968_t:CDS:2 [Ambispora gerdemannii]
MGIAVSKIYSSKYFKDDQKSKNNPMSQTSSSSTPITESFFNPQQLIAKLEMKRTCSKSKKKTIQDESTFNTVYAPIHETLKEGALALDVGCGMHGTWLTDMANHYPRSLFTGIDKQPLQDCTLPPNAIFSHANLLDGITFPKDTFSYVHSRFWVAYLNNEEWKLLVGEIIRVTRPGGYIEIIELDVMTKDAGKQTSYLNNSFLAMLDARGIGLMTDQIEKILLDSEKVEIVSNEAQSLPIGKCAETSGDMSFQDMEQGYIAIKPYLCPYMKISEDDYDSLVALARYEARNMKATIPARHIIARKLVSPNFVTDPVGWPLIYKESSVSAFNLNNVQ